MGKRKERSKASKREDEESSSDSGDDILDVDFEFFDPQASDFHGFKNLIRQLFDVDSQLLDLSALADLILSQPLLGSTVKTDGNESDPYAFLTVINLKEHAGKLAIKTLLDYAIQQSSKNAALAPVAQTLQGNNTVGLILTERLINIPVEVIPPMYRMLLEEITWANEEKEPYTFTHYLIISKTYREIESQLDQEENGPQKKKKKGGNAKSEVFNFHPEDPIIQRSAIAYGDYPYVKEGADSEADSKRAFQDLGIKPQGHMILLEAAKYEAMVKSLEDALQPITGVS